MSYTEIHEDAFKTEVFNSYEYPAILLTSESREPSQRLVDGIASRTDAQGNPRPIPKLVWYQCWHQLDRPTSFDTVREIVPPLKGGELRNAKIWQHALESFQKCGVVITSPADFKKVEGRIFQVRRGDLNTGNAQRPFIVSNVVTPLRELSASDITKLSVNGTAPIVDEDLNEAIRDFIKDQLTQQPMEWGELEAEVTAAFNDSGDVQTAQVIRNVLDDVLNKELIKISTELRGKLVWNA